MQILLRLKIFASLFTVSLLFWGCVASSSGQKEAEALRAAELEDRIARNEEALTDLTHRLSVMQFMVDDHENMLRLGEKPKAPKVQVAPSGSSKATAKSPSPTPKAATPAAVVTAPVGDIQEQPAPSKAAPAPKASSPPAGNPAQLYNYAFATLQDRDYDKAGRLFRELADSYPDHALANNALYWQGECYYAKGDFRTAIIIFEELAERYPKGIKVPDSILKRAYAYINLGDKVKARELLNSLVREYPTTPAASKAEGRLKNLS